MFLYSRNENFSFGSGVRFYNLDQKNLVVSTQKGSDFFSVGPEVLVYLVFDNKSSVSMQGWYEFQYLNDKPIREMPNFSLSTSIVF
jgi:hypothetical protein